MFARVLQHDEPHMLRALPGEDQRRDQHAHQCRDRDAIDKRRPHEAEDRQTHRRTDRRVGKINEKVSMVNGTCGRCSCGNAPSTDAIFYPANSPTRPRKAQATCNVLRYKLPGPAALSRRGG